MIKIFDPEKLRERLITYMKKKPISIIHHAKAIGISYNALIRFLDKNIQTRTNTLFKVGIYLDKEEKKDK